MEYSDLKDGLHKMIDEVKDVDFLKAMYSMLEHERSQEQSDSIHQLDPKAKEEIERGLEQINRGETISHDEVRLRTSKWLR